VPWEGINYLFVTDAQRSMFKYQEIVAQLDTPRAAEDMRAVLREREQEEAKPCPPLASAAVPSSALLIALFCLIGLTLGFLFRGYVIRRIEGGL
jgi:uncharacterized membrane protein